jgi:hypothetical protein
VKRKVVLGPGTAEFRIVQAFICSKMTVKIEMISAVKNDASERLAQMEEKCKYISIVVDDGLHSTKAFEQQFVRPMVVADHMNHLVRQMQKSGEATFMICAFDNGRTMVDAGTERPQIAGVAGEFDSVLFQVKRSQFFSVLNPERVTPLYLVSIRPVQMAD